MTAEQQARDMLERMGVEDAQRFTAGDLVELANMIADLAEQCRLLGMGSEREARLMAQLAESQARELRLREALRLCSGVLEEDGRDATAWLAQTAMEAASDDTALREMIEAEREACAQEAERQMEDEPYGHAKFRCANIAEAIRARKG